MLSRLEISDFRNLSDVKIYPCENFNIFYGENGSGKTSLLEAIYHLGVGRSFRTSVLSNLIQRGCEKFSVFGEVSSVPIGIERFCNGEFSIRVQKKDIYSAAELANTLPLQLIDHSIYNLIDLGPKTRRNFIDWGMFHVKHSDFLFIWKKMRRLLKQRNSALKMKPVLKKNIEIWDADFVDTAYLIDSLRREYLDDFRPIFSKVIKELLDVDEVELVFYSGWSEKKTLNEALKESLIKDIERGYTQLGPHRADLRFFINRVPVYDALSRGQLKLFTCAMKLAQAVLLKENMQKQCVFLIDDLASELDEKHQKIFCDFLSKLNSQVFLTSARFGSFDDLFCEKKINIFNINHGIISN